MRRMPKSNGSRVQWPPVIPHRLRKDLAHFTFTPQGAVVRWYKGRTRHVSGKTTPLERIADVWKDKAAQIDAEER
jgi:hypothetical protein